MNSAQPHVKSEEVAPGDKETQEQPSLGAPPYKRKTLRWRAKAAPHSSGLCATLRHRPPGGQWGRGLSELPRFSCSWKKETGSRLHTQVALKCSCARPPRPSYGLSVCMTTTPLRPPWSLVPGLARQGRQSWPAPPGGILGGCAHPGSASATMSSGSPPGPRGRPWWGLWRRTGVQQPRREPGRDSVINAIIKAGMCPNSMSPHSLLASALSVPSFPQLL